MKMDKKEEVLRFKRLGIMLDCSRNAVKSVAMLKVFIRMIKKMGYTTLMLYTEDTYEVDNQPYFGYMRGRYSQEELKEIDRFAGENDIELIPCIQTLAHLNAIVHWPVYEKITDCNDILLAEDERTYELIDHMFATLEKCYSTRLVNIGLDEAFMVGLGKYLRIHSYENQHGIFVRHLHKVREIAMAHGFQVLMWGDMLFRSYNDGKYQCEAPVVGEHVPDEIPEDVGVIYWDYYDYRERNEIHYHEMFKAHKKLRNELWFASGGWTWSGFTPRNYMAEIVDHFTFPLCEKYQVENIILTMWGNDGCVCPVFSALPAIFHAAELARGNYDMNLVAKRFEEQFGVPYEAFKLLDLPGKIGCDTGRLKNPEKYMFFADPFLGFYDSTVVDGEGGKFEEISGKLSPWVSHGEWGHLFDAVKKLCDVLSIKYELGVRLRRAYQTGNRPELRRCGEDCRKTTQRIVSFQEALRITWMKENKAYGYETWELRFGGLMLRLESCAKRVEDFLEGRIECVEELEEELLDMEGNGRELQHRTEARGVSVESPGFPGRLQSLRP